MMLIVLLQVLLSLVQSQVHVKGVYQEVVQQVLYQKSADNENLPIYRPIEKVNNGRLLTEELFTEGNQSKPYKFAESLPFDLDISKDGSWLEAKAFDGTSLKVWQAIVSSDEAVSLSIQFEKFKLPAGAEFYISSRDKMIGAFTPAVNNREDGSFATAPIAGDFLGLILVIPVDKYENLFKILENDTQFKIATIAHGFRGFPVSKMYQDSGSCNIDVACETSPVYEKQIRSVAMMVTRDGTRFCSGTMINNAEGDRRQLFLTANHCMSGTAFNHVAVFNYQHSECNPEDPAAEPVTTQSASGMRLLASWAPSDFALLEIIEKIPKEYNVFLAGWNTLNVPATNVYGIHHPSCDVKKITYYNGTLRRHSWDEAPRQLHWMIPKWTRGTTEPGSSGSGLFNSQGQLIGQLHGGAAACGNPEGWDTYGGLAFSWNGGNVRLRRLRDHLNPRNRRLTFVNGLELHS